MDERFYSIVLSCIPGIGPVHARHLITAMGSAQAIFEQKAELKDRFPTMNKKMADSLSCPNAFLRAEEEMKFIEKNQIRCLTMQDEDYPSRLRECDDAPIVLFYRGKADMNAPKVITMVGTRRATSYGQDICSHFLSDLSTFLPDLLVVSGLAYGIDVCSHRAALENGYDTIGVLAHGLDRLYPSLHRGTAIKMIEQGGLLTEFLTRTNPDRQNFVMRNRIVAGMSDATIIVESAIKGGALITAELAGSYQRDCFAFPGRINDEFSAGCNNLIKNNKAGLITSAKDFIETMGWNTGNAKPQVIQRQLFPNLNEEEQAVVDRLQRATEGLQINTLVVETNIPVHRISVLLFGLEMKGIIRAQAGGMYRMVN
ncbi:DNA protecting protein DprA [Bacteroidetes bacterium oral taxon 272 str. F0290]|nr:DNA protecting protein DprA [Bacteroidetes bacterium oral taxon 272 str. F0290]